MKKTQALKPFAEAIAQGDFLDITYREHEGQQNIAVRYGKQFYLYINEDDTVSLHISGTSFPVKYAEMVRLLAANNGKVVGTPQTNTVDPHRWERTILERNWWQRLVQCFHDLF